MKFQKTNPGSLERLIKFFYQIIFPVTTTFFLLIVSGELSRPLFSGSKMLDFLARLWLSFMFCFGYIMLSDFEKYKTWFYGKRMEDPGVANDGVKMVWNIGVSIIFGVFAAVISWWTVKMFLPNLNNIALILALLHGCIFAVPISYYGNRFNF